MNCPKCGFAQPDEHEECAKCGLIFSRYKAKMEGLPLPPAPPRAEAPPPPPLPSPPPRKKEPRRQDVEMSEPPMKVAIPTPDDDPELATVYSIQKSENAAAPKISVDAPWHSQPEPRTQASKSRSRADTEAEDSPDGVRDLGNAEQIRQARRSSGLLQDPKTIKILVVVGGLVVSSILTSWMMGGSSSSGDKQLAQFQQLLSQKRAAGVNLGEMENDSSAPTPQESGSAADSDPQFPMTQDGIRDLTAQMDAAAQRNTPGDLEFIKSHLMSAVQIHTRVTEEGTVKELNEGYQEFHYGFLGGKAAQDSLPGAARFFRRTGLRVESEPETSNLVAQSDVREETTPAGKTRINQFHEVIHFQEVNRRPMINRIDREGTSDWAK